MSNQIDENYQKAISVELQKTSQIRTELSNAVVELELNTRRYDSVLHESNQLYINAVMDIMKKKENGLNISSVNGESVPTTDLEVHCFPTTRRDSSNMRQPIALPRDKFDKFRLFDV
jgi:hypothetical protein